MNSIRRERVRQVDLKAEGRFKYTPDEVPTIRSQAMLSEENGEVARAVLALSGWVQEELTVEDLYKELTQVAAVACAMMEGLLMRTSDYEAKT